jgi:hypothetical protein
MSLFKYATLLASGQLLEQMNRSSTKINTVRYFRQTREEQKSFNVKLAILFAL